MPFPDSSDTPSAADAPATSSPTAYRISAVACTSMLALPFLLVDIPPITDLPQLTAQIRLLFETLGADGGEYRIQWWHPNKLGYAPLLLTWMLAPPIAAGRLGLLVIGLLWTASLHWLAHATGRPPAAAALATVFFFNHVTYWGFLHFVIGLPAFVVWFVLLDRQPPARPGWRDGPMLLAAAGLLYSAHVLWLAAGLAWLVVSGLGRRLPLATLARRLAWTAPVLALTIVWYPRLGQSGFVSATVWGHSLLERLHPGWLLSSALGGLAGPAEPLLGLVIAGWLIHGFVTRKTAPGGPTDRGLLAAGLLCAAAALSLPSILQNTIHFASRWLPAGAALLALACPPTGRHPVFRTFAPYAVLAAFTLATAVSWVDFEKRDLDGLVQALEVPSDERLLSLDFTRTSERFEHFPFFHLGAWAQARYGCELNASFANIGTSLVVFRDLPRELPWTEGLDWTPRNLRASDIEHFRHVLVFGGPEVHETFLGDERLTPVTGEKPWRLYRVGAQG